MTLALLLLGLAASGPSARAEGEARALDAFFKGQVVALTKDKVLTLRYDFASQEQLADWKQGVPWPIAKEEGEAMRWFDERLEIKGSTGARHLAEWSGDIWVTATLTLDSDKDLGAFLNPEFVRRSVNLRRQIIEHAHPMTLRKCKRSQARADEAGPSSDQDMRHSLGSP